MGFVQGLLAGNALLIHDVEHSLLHTSLGIDIEKGLSTAMGHRNHIIAVNELFKAGSVKKIVTSGKLKSGIFYECVKILECLILEQNTRERTHLKKNHK